MTFDWYQFLFVCTCVLVLAILIVGWKRFSNFRHFGALFLFLMYVTYVIRPFLAYTVGDGLTFLSNYLPGSELLVTRDLVPLTLTFSAAIIFFALGYRWLRRPDLEFDLLRQNSNADLQFFQRFALLLIVAGYGSFLLSSRNPFDSRQAEYIRYTGGVVYGNTTGYVEFANYFVVSGALLYFAATKKLARTLILAMPWLISQIYFGWARYMYLNLAVGLAAIALSDFSWSSQRSRTRRLIPVGLAVAALLLLISMRANRDFIKAGETLIDTVNSTVSLPVDEVLGDFSGFEGTWFTIHNFETLTPRYGAGIFYQYFILPIPRLLWADKPLKVEFSWPSLFGNKDNKDSLANNQWRSSLTVASDFVWYNTAVKGSIGYALEEWGWIGIPINFLLTGFFFAWIERRFAISGFSTAWVATYAATYGLITMQGRNDLFEFLLIYALVFYAPYAFAQKLVHSQFMISHARRMRNMRNVAR